MIDYSELMRLLSRPRPNGSAAEQQTCQALQGWLQSHHIPYHTHTFRIYPYFFEAIGLWLIVSRTLLALAIALRWGWPAFWIGWIGLLGGLVDVALGFPFVGRPISRSAQNILIQFDPPPAEPISPNPPPPARPEQELVFSAHFDSKTELLDHRQRMVFVRSLPLGILLTIVLALLGPLDRALLQAGSPAAPFTYGLGLLLSLPLLYLAWGLGLSLSLGRLRAPSQGAVDNGAACAILLGLANRVAGGELKLHRTRLTLALFTGEEVNMQGSRAYIDSREWPLPAAALNLEVMAQNGEYVIWEQDGTSLKLVPVSARLNQAVSAAVEEVTGAPPRPVGPINSDGYSFLRRRIPSTTLGTYDRRWVDRGFHHATDNLDRVVIDRLPQGVEILACLARRLDSAPDEFLQIHSAFNGHQE